MDVLFYERLNLRNWILVDLIEFYCLRPDGRARRKLISHNGYKLRVVRGLYKLLLVVPMCGHGSQLFTHTNGGIDPGVCRLPGGRVTESLARVLMRENFCPPPTSTPDCATGIE